MKRFHCLLWLVLCAFMSSASGKALKATMPLSESESIITPSTITLDLENAKVTDILDAIEKQTGNKICTGEGFNNASLPRFQVDGLSFWQTIEALSKDSGNHYLWGKRKG